MSVACSILLFVTRNSRLSSQVESLGIYAIFYGGVLIALSLRLMGGGKTCVSMSMQLTHTDSRESIRQGHGMGQTLERSHLFPPLLIQMIKVGEISGELERMLERVADNYEREVESSLNQVANVIQPVMTLVMAGVILFMMLAVLMPIFQLNQLMQ